MALLDAYQSDTDKVLDYMATAPLDQVSVPKHSGWTTVPRAVGAGVVEVGGGVTDILGAYGQTMAATGANRHPLLPESQKDAQEREAAYQRLRTEGVDFRTPESQAFYSVARDMRPDPATAGKAENIVFGLTKGLTKAVGGAVLTGPAGGAAILGASEGLTTAEDLAVEGVDKETRTKAGLTVGSITGVTALIPVAGQTMKQTLGLAAVSGPGAFIAQQAATRTILENANYDELALQYDPLDPVGLSIATLLPLGFGAYAKRSTIKASIKKRAEASPATPDQVDAAMVHNLTLQADAHEAMPPASRYEDIGVKLQKKLEADYNAARAEYDALNKPDFNSEGGRILNTDLARELSPEYQADRTRSADVHEPASAFVKRMYTEKLAELPEGAPVLFTAGGTGAGKSSALAGQDHGYPLVYDTNMNRVESAVAKIDEALAAGHPVDVAYIYRDPVDALTDGSLPRAMRMGRTVPMNEHLATHAGSRNTVEALQDHYKDNPNVRITVIDNSRGKGNQVTSSLDALPKQDYTQAERRLYAALDEAFQEGRISPEIYAGSAGKPAPSSQTGAKQSQRNAGADQQSPRDQVTPTGSDHADPTTRSVLEQGESLSTSNPDMPVAVREDGSHASAADALDAVRKVAQEGTDDTLGGLDADLVKAAADCFLSTGAA